MFYKDHLPPHFHAIYGEYEITVDDAYIMNSIYEPNIQVVKGYNAGLMIPYQEQIDTAAMEEVIDYLKTLK